MFRSASSSKVMLQVALPGFFPKANVALPKAAADFLQLALKLEPLFQFRHSIHAKAACPLPLRCA